MNTPHEHNTGSTVDLITLARQLGITVVSGILGPPTRGSMWINGRTLDEILCPSQAERQATILIAPGGTGRTHIRVGERTLDAEGMRRLVEAQGNYGGSIVQGWLAVLTPTSWLQSKRSEQTTFAAAVASGWPNHCGNSPALFLGEHSMYSLLAQANVGATVTMLVATSAA